MGDERVPLFKAAGRDLTDPAPVVVIKVGVEDSETAVALRSVPGPFVFPGKSCDRCVVSLPPGKQIS